VLTIRGVRPASVLAFVLVKSRQVIATRAAFHPTRRWTEDAAACVAGEIEEAGLPSPTIVVCDNTRSSGAIFDAELADQGIKAERPPAQAPMCNSHVERWIQSLRQECLDHFDPVGLKH
jgi:putative transposase